MRKLTVLLFVSCFINICSAITLEQAYLKSLNNDAKWQSDIANNNAQRALNSIASSALLPQVVIQGKIGKTEQLVNYISDDIRYNHEQLSGKITQSLFRPDQWYAYRSAEVLDDVLALDADNINQQQIQTVSDQYFKVMEGYLQYQYAEQTKNSAALFTDLTIAQTELGMLKPSETQLSFSNLALAEAQALAAKQKYDIETIRFQQIVGEPLRFDGYEIDQISVCVECLEQTMDQTSGVDNNIQVKQTAKNYKVEGYQHLESLSTLLPQINAYASYGFDKAKRSFGAAPVRTDTTQLEYGLEMNWPLYLGGAVMKQIEASSYEKEAAQAQMIDVKQEVENQYQLALLQYHQNKKLTEAQQKAYDYSKALLDEAELKLKLGSISQVQLAKAKADFLDSKYQLALSQFNVLRAWMQVQEVVGNLNQQTLAIASQALSLNN